ncbi:putative START-like domain-containing protein [Rosa chinensis]|uniref:Putative START-like domain-containing protein n=1 Tax=Rosa chinensis TaxID=74649 RepID=A0A2P6R3G7_ROSCH|nr:putative START-like domain-containing protein [Rosa chinensis]
MALTGKIETDVEIKASAAKFHEMFTHKPHHISNVSSNNIQGCDLHEGDWGTVGTIIYWNYFHDLMEHYKSFLITIQATPKGEGCSVHWTMEYEKHHGDITDPHTLLQFAVEVSNDIDVHLTAQE